MDGNRKMSFGDRSYGKAVLAVDFKGAIFPYYPEQGFDSFHGVTDKLGVKPEGTSFQSARASQMSPAAANHRYSRQLDRILPH
ncbi:hypothetical protein JMJ77_0010035 [Colletotrichum scovillei]|uniref:Uncharacterized protein n=1 Tax=Colletotrichum scovillei TaxID=1209932 RepID=A0A9P7U3Q8_9PEZI|nr:hypothetical protein JMJ78_0001106 [Colletotrichum scovillei]KAG7040931.1 hypothetical protein JMJ77_0010035 [Colletotrichum scovillei]KAG7060966.1 hypothetical protein JMJ76_0010039 [Colletotrichum scovillei]